MESLGERVALHLENARLFDELHDKIGALDVEKALRDRFVSMLAHDLRGPLAAARLSAELLAMQPANPDERRELALKVDHNIERVDRMIRDLLDANRIRAGEAGTAGGAEGTEHGGTNGSRGRNGRLGCLRRRSRGGG
jgi:signal transduction histidine kinase